MRQPCILLGSHPTVPNSCSPLYRFRLPTDAPNLEIVFIVERQAALGVGYNTGVQVC
jgi:hypothetical protein